MRRSSSCLTRLKKFIVILVRNCLKPCGPTSKRPFLISARNSTCRRLKPLSSTTTRMLSCRAEPAWHRHPSAWILELPTGYGIQARCLFVVASFVVGFGMYMFWSDNALAEVEPSDSSAAPGESLLASTGLSSEQSSCDRRHTLFGYLLPHLDDFETHDTLALGTQVPKDWPASPVNIAHRGGRYLAPENTLVGFQKGLLAGADVLEFEVHLTADKAHEHLVVIHDNEVDQTTDGTGVIREMTLQEIKQLDAGYEFTDDDGKTYPYRDLGITVPTLEEVYQAFPKTPVNIEIKEDQPGIERALWREIEKAEAENRTLVVSGKMSVISRFREVSGGEVATGASIREMIVFLLWSHLYPSWPLCPSYDALQVPKEVVTSGFVQAAQRSNVRVDVWTVNTEQGMRRLLGYGVDGIMTDRPDLLNRVLQGEGKA